MVDEAIENLVVNDIRKGLFQYLMHNPQDSASNIAIEMVSNGTKIEFVSKIAGLSVDEINKIQKGRH